MKTQTKDWPLRQQWRLNEIFCAYSKSDKISCVGTSVLPNKTKSVTVITPHTKINHQLES